MLILHSKVGLVAVLPVGMSNVSSVTMTVNVGQYLNKGDEFGHFLFGGSDYIMLFENEQTKVSLQPNTHYLCNVQAATAPIMYPDAPTTESSSGRLLLALPMSTVPFLVALCWLSKLAI